MRSCGSGARRGRRTLRSSIPVNVSLREGICGSRLILEGHRDHGWAEVGMRASVEVALGGARMEAGADEVAADSAGIHIVMDSR